MSDFVSKRTVPVEDSGAVDFSKATKLARNGSTCDCFMATVHRRKVFVKRLKEGLRFSPLHLAAFDKEFDIGVKLNHPSLPEYREFYGNYIVMDYVDGLTVADMIHQNDPWLTDEDNLKKLIKQLVDVIDYLHQCNVVHCDIKPDNVMITMGTHNVMLIDLDKAYTDWLADTSGTPENYDLATDAVGSPDLDFRGVGKIITRLREAGYARGRFFAQFIKLCDKRGITANVLLKKLAESENATGKSFVIPIIAGSFIALFAGFVFLYKSLPDTTTSNESNELVAKVDTIYKETVAPLPTPAMQSEQKEITKAVPNYKDEINSEISTLLKPLMKELDQYESLANDSATPDSTLQDLMYELIEKQTKTMGEAYAEFKKRYPEINPMDIELTVASSPTFRAMLDRNSMISKKIADRLNQAE